MADVLIQEFNETFIRILTEPGIEAELQEKFTFYADNYKFNPRYRNRQWDGKIRLYNKRTKQIYKGLLADIEQFCIENDYTVTYDGDFSTDEFSIKEATDFIKTLNLPDFIELRDYQIETFATCIKNKRRLFVSPTASGKSLILYFIYRYLKKKTLLIVPTINLVNQMESDMIEYGYTGKIHKIQGGTAKDDSDANLYVSTYQSLVSMPDEYFEQFDVILGDESHKWKSKSLIDIMQKATTVKYKFGFTGTLSESTVNALVLTGLFGKIEQIVTTRELIDAGHLSEINIKAICLGYKDDVKSVYHKELRKITDKTKKYAHEIDFLVSNEARNRFIKNLALSLPGNGLILFNRVDSHGIPLHAAIEASTDKPVYLVHGDTGSDDREYIRRIVNTHTDSITLGSMGVFAEGTNIPNINWIILSHPSKSKIKVLQMIGRGLRKSETKSTFTLFDISDDLSLKKNVNYTLTHFGERIRYYIQEKFNYKIFRVTLK